MAEHHAERMIAANGIEICADAFGDPADPCILLIMGAGSSMLLWEEDFCAQLADGGRFVIRYDNRDTGKTTSCPVGEPNYTLQDMAADAPAVLDAYGVAQAHVMGASMGGMIAQLVALNHPERVLTLTPIMSTPDPSATLEAIDEAEAGGGPPPLSPPHAQVLAVIAEMGALDYGDRAQVLANRVAMFSALRGSGYADEGVNEALYAAELDRAANFASTLNHGPAIAQSEGWRERLSELNVPTLVIHGDEDPILPYDHGQALAAEIPSAELLTLTGVGHELPRGTWADLMPKLLAHTS